MCTKKQHGKSLRPRIRITDSNAENLYFIYAGFQHLFYKMALLWFYLWAE